MSAFSGSSTEDGRWPAAEALWRDVTRGQPGFAAGWAGLARACLVQGKWADAEAVLTRLEELGRADEVAELRVQFPRPGQV